MDQRGNCALINDALPALSREEFLQWQHLLNARFGFWLPEHRLLFLQVGLRQRIRKLGCADYKSYFEGLQQNQWSPLEWIYLIDQLTVSETRFCRDMDALELVETFIQSKLAQQTIQERFVAEVWSVGCATGQEPYSIGFILEQMRTQYPRFYYGITATDISYEALDYARQGVYTETQLHSLPKVWRENFLTPFSKGKHQVCQQVRERIRFVQGNVLTPHNLPRQKFDVVFCQNMLIYIAPEQRQKVLNSMVSRLSEGGVMILGPGEVTRWTHPNMTRIDNPHCFAFIRNRISK